jgi:hypothetical protein
MSAQRDWERARYYDNLPSEQALYEQEQAEQAAVALAAEQLAAAERDHRMARGAVVARVVRTHLHAGVPISFANADAAAAAREFDLQAGRVTTPLDLRKLGS